MNHYVALLILSVCVATVFTFISRDHTRDRIRYFLRLLAYMVVGSFVMAWIMYAVP